MEKSLTLDEIGRDYSNILFDNCSLQGYSPRNRRGRIPYLIQIDCLEVILKYIKDLSCYIPESVIDEIKKASNGINKKKNIDLRRLKIVQQRTIDSFCGRKKVIRLNENEKNISKDLYKKYKKFRQSKELSKVDFDFIVCGRTLIETRGSCALISNDWGIFYMWKDILRNEKLSSKKLGFFCRKDLYEFNRLYNGEYIR